MEGPQTQDATSSHTLPSTGLPANRTSIIEQWLDGNKAAFEGNNTENQNSLPFIPGTIKVPDCFAIDSKDANDLLLMFRNSMASQFPFVVIQPHETSASLRSKKPFLWKAIMTAASHQNLERQVAMGKSFTEEFSTYLLLYARKSLDMLQGLLVHLAWYVSFAHVTKV